MRILVLLLVAGAAFAADSIEALGRTWTVPVKADWSGTPDLLKMLVPHADTRSLPRRPNHYALAGDGPFENVTMDVEIRVPEKNHMILIYAWKDESHFNYVHLSPDSPSKQPVHNGIFHVYGGDRVRISNTEGPAAVTDAEWMPVRMTYSAKTHLVEVAVRGKVLPSLRAVDYSLGAGKVGLGSFFHVAEFRNLKIKGK
jgi:hypothetical protein